MQNTIDALIQYTKNKQYESIKTLLDSYEENQKARALELYLVELYKGNALREDAYMRANRVYKMLEQVVPLADDRIVPKDSVIREFIGGSDYNLQ